jgi:type III secretion protein N (ATPase)
VAAPGHVQSARRLRELLSKFDEVEVLLRMGEFQRGADPEADQAVDRRPALERFLRQPRTEAADFVQTLAGLQAAVS